MTRKHLLLALPLTLALSAGGYANDNDKDTAAGGESSQAVETLKSSLSSTRGFEVVSVRTASDGSACITYNVANDMNGQSRSHAVVKGDKVLRETTGNRKFAKAWNENCVGST